MSFKAAASWLVAVQVLQYSTSQNASKHQENGLHTEVLSFSLAICSMARIEQRAGIPELQCPDTGHLVLPSGQSSSTTTSLTTIEPGSSSQLRTWKVMVVDPGLLVFRPQ